MLDDATTGGSMPTPLCNWCSAPLPSDHEVTCPSCGATLLGDGDTAVPGLTAIDAEAILRNARAAKAKPRSRLLGWISGDYDEGAAPAAAASPGSLAPPPAEVRREMLRLEIEAQLQNAQAEAESLAADAAVEEGLSLDALASSSTGAPAASGASADLDADGADDDPDAAAAAADTPVPATPRDDDEAPPA